MAATITHNLHNVEKDQPHQQQRDVHMLQQRQAPTLRFSETKQ